MKNPLLNIIFSISFLALLLGHAKAAPETWNIGSATEWKAAIESSDGITIEKGVASPSAKAGSLRTKMKTFKVKRSAKSLPSSNRPFGKTGKQSPALGRRTCGMPPCF